MPAYAVVWTSITPGGQRRTCTHPAEDWRDALAAADSLRSVLPHPSRVVVLEDGRPRATYADGERVDRPVTSRHTSTPDVQDAAPVRVAVSETAIDMVLRMWDRLRKRPESRDRGAVATWLREALATAHELDRPQEEGRVLLRAASSHGRIHLVLSPERDAVIAVLAERLGR